MKKPDFYTILGVARSATHDEIKRAFRALAKTHHSDKGGENEEFQRISEAYEALGDSEKRKAYDESLSQAVVQNIQTAVEAVVDEFLQQIKS